MSEEAREVISEEEEFFNEPSLDEIIEDSEERTYGETEENVVSKEEEPKEETEETREEEGLTDERFDELAGKYPALKEHKSYFENYNKWEKTQRQKSQAIPFLGKLHEENPEKFEAVINEIMPYVYGKKDLPKAPDDLVDELMNGLEIKDFSYTDDEDFEVKVSKDKITPMVREIAVKMLNTAVPSMTVLRNRIGELEANNTELQEGFSASTARQGELEMEKLLTDHPMLDILRT